MICIFLADGFEEIEALTPLDIFRRAGLEAITASVGKERRVRGAHNIEVMADLSADQVDFSKLTLVLFPGGMPGAENLDASPFTDEAIEAVMKNGGRIAAICAAPLILARRGLLDGKRAVCYPGFEAELKGAKIQSAPVVTDGNITTSRGMGSALAFALELTSLLADDDAAKKIFRSIQIAHDADLEKFN